jgi:archaellum biogenesis protein FlaJ (TadC family)
LLVALAWPCVGLLALVFVSATLIVGVAFFQAPTDAMVEISKIVTHGQLLQRAMALLIIVPAIVILAIDDKIQGSAAIAAIAAIAGYVLAGQTQTP